MKYDFFNRDLSWLSFNYRVLEEAYDNTLPLYERIKFLAIYSNNLEEFFQVRVSYYRSLIRNLKEDDQKFKQVQPKKILQKITSTVSKQQTEFQHLLLDSIVPELKDEGIILIDRNSELDFEQLTYARHVFEHQVLTAIQPVLLIKNRIKPFLKTGHQYLALRLFTKSANVDTITKTARPQYGLLKLPTDHNISRFIELPRSKGKYYIMMLEDLIYRFLDIILPGYYIDSVYSIKITRDADLEYEEFEGDELIDLIEELSSARAIGEPTRFQYHNEMPANMLRFLQETFDIDKDILVAGGSRHNFRDFFSFPNPMAPELEHEKLISLQIPELDSAQFKIAQIAKKEYLLHFPYQSFKNFIDLLNEAAKDDTVKEIFATQYRVATNSAVVDALINAAVNGKKVTVFVELKARFDEETNLIYSREMKQAGINIIYSIPGLKVHSKFALIIRSGNSKDIAFLGTGNFNEKTARLYGDHGYFTSDKRIISDLYKLVDYLRTREIKEHFDHILVPKINMVESYKRFIQDEIEHAKNGNKAYIILKVNGLEDPYMIEQLYKASEAGVKIDLIIRGICRLIPGKSYSSNIRVIRIIDRFLEHARVFYFYNNGDERLYMGSADWMRRNLYRRIECVFPIYNPKLRQEVLDILNIQLADNVSARLITKKLENVKIKTSEPPVRSQQATYEYLKEKYKQ